MAELRIGRLTLRIDLQRPSPNTPYDSRRIIRWSLATSTVLHFLLLPLMVALFALPFLHLLTQQKQPQEIVTVSSAVRLEKRAKPIPQHVAQQPRVVRAVQQVRPRQAAAQRQAPPQRIAALSKPDDRATVHYVEKRPQPEPSALSAQDLEKQQQAFERTIALAKAQDDPVTAAARPVPDPAARKHYAINIQGDTGDVSFGEGILIPVKRWSDGPYTYYYVRYSVIYPDGTSEEGIVPWPIHFLATDDPFARGIRHMPLPGPGSDFTATSGGMQPLVRNCYDHRYTYCPIARESNAG